MPPPRAAAKIAGGLEAVTDRNPMILSAAILLPSPRASCAPPTRLATARRVPSVSPVTMWRHGLDGETTTSPPRAVEAMPVAALQAAGVRGVRA
eukprot:15446831-Alexandrium_andersonii.AAC.1